MVIIALDIIGRFHDRDQGLDQGQDRDRDRDEIGLFREGLRLERGRGRI